MEKLYSWKLLFFSWIRLVIKIIQKTAYRKEILLRQQRARKLQKLSFIRNITLIYENLLKFFKSIWDPHLFPVQNSHTYNCDLWWIAARYIQKSTQYTSGCIVMSPSNSTFVVWSKCTTCWYSTFAYILQVFRFVISLFYDRSWISWDEWDLEFWHLKISVVTICHASFFCDRSASFFASFSSQSNLQSYWVRLV